jgi:5'-3' exonuclease
MGIKHLNRYLTNNCNNQSIKKLHLKEFTGKKIAIDASIYLYRFIGENRLIEHMYLMISIFTHYNITPIFVFDGMSPPEKKGLLIERKENKRLAEEKYEIIKKQLDSDLDSDEKYEIQNELDKLKKQFIYIKDSDYKTVKTLLDDCGIMWIDAPGEADELCARLIHSNQVYACLSEDMDLFAYGCSRILRHLSLVKHSVLFYDLAEILCQLQMNVQDFRQVIVLSGTDYNKDEITNLFDSINWFKAYKRHTILCEGDIPTFYEWLLHNSDYIKSPETLRLTYKMFDISRKELTYNYHNENKKINKPHLIQFLAQDGFVFV